MYQGKFAKKKNGAVPQREPGPVMPDPEFEQLAENAVLHDMDLGELPGDQDLLTHGNQASGQMPPQGRPMPPQGMPVPSQGRPMPPQGRPMPPQGMPVPPQGRPMPPQGRPMPPQGRPMPPQGRPMPPQGRPMPPQGRPMPPQGRPMPPQGRPMPPQGRPVPPQGRPMPPQDRPMPPQGRPQPAQGAMPPQMLREQMRQMPPPMGAPIQEQPEAPRKRSHTGGLIFYTIFFAGILAFYIFSYSLLGSLQDWLVRYESAQPTRKCQEVFSQYFENPDWAKLYDLAGIQQTTYEGKDAFAAYMEERVGDQKLTYLETSAGMSKDKKYVVRLGNEKIASFTLTDVNQAVEVTDIPDWQLGEIQLFFQGSGSYKIEILAGYQTTVNGVVLDDTSTIREATTKVGEYLPDGITVPALLTQKVTGLMTVPEVTVTDAAGKPVAVTYDEASHTFRAELAQAHGGVGQAEQDRALKALKTYAVYMSQKSGGDDKLSEYFQRGTDLYKTLASMERMWNQSYSSYDLTDESVTDCVRYSEDIFSARVSVKLHLVRSDGSEKVTDIDRSMFFKNYDGKWKCYDMTAVDVSEPVEKVRLTFRTEQEILQNEMVNAAAPQIQCPVVAAPEGKVFGGWLKETFRDNGDRVLSLVLKPDDKGLTPMPADLEPMVLYPLFEDAAN